ncbi:hypothetical protein NQ016_02780 [Staphylococcus hyicus]|uniref:hypothetical protein n=1 Tax=Staphylococcus hyicus TaxID=1284 RepID=UPI00211C04BC|nr:hypothetical protein [Staphylococcus hyicus]MCQ9290444.1 hypothetical protein [Staphylococcus hyicus]MCQ9305686.1 hypothetical protein [Staphylococcus hyicus]MCQ9308098.1 hypothetical protein [Staphylococcus hyicus]MCQ9310520.1 hypothetical protein [Staphylococcus hyicus]
MHIGLIIILSLLSITLLIHNTLLQKKNDTLSYTVGILASHIFDENGEDYVKKLMK